jgi:hypothetical protein
MKSVIVAAACMLVEGSTTCTEAGKGHYFSFETVADEHFCTESCLLKSEFEALLPFDNSLALADRETPCQERGYGTLVSSELHAKGPLFRSVDFYTRDDASVHV